VAWVGAIEAEEIEYDVGHANGRVAVEDTPAQRREVELAASPRNELAVEHQASRKVRQLRDK